jgi:hypothetical protein
MLAQAVSALPVRSLKVLLAVLGLVSCHHSNLCALKIPFSTMAVLVMRA